MANVTAAEVRDRLRTISATGAMGVSDTLLASAAYIPAGDGWLNKVLSNNGKTYAALETDDQAIAKAVELDWITAKVIAAAPLRENETGPIVLRDVKADAKKVMLDHLREEIRELLALIGCRLVRASFMAKTSDDYKPDGEDNVNLIWTDTDETTHSQWP